MDGGNVVGKEHNLVGPKLRAVLPLHIGVCDQSRLEEPHQEDPGPGEGIEHVHPLVAESPAKLLAQNVVRACEDEIHDLDRGVHDPQPIRLLPERIREELLVELHQHALPGFGIVEPGSALPDARVERLEVADLVLEAELAEVPPKLVERPGHRVAGGEVVVLEQRLEDGPGEAVLRHHLDGVFASDRVVDGLLQLGVEGVEPLA